MKVIRSPIVCVLGHIDHGKTSILDAIRHTKVGEREAGRITQMIGSSYISRESIEKDASEFIKKMKFEIKIPGLLFIDTPGHESFTNLRERGGSIADIAILVVDIIQGIQPQTVESLRILRNFKTPFVIAANKVDLIPGWRSGFPSFLSQAPHVQQSLDRKVYSLVAKLSEHGFNGERFDRVTDFTKQVSIVPVSAKSKDGMTELLVLIAGLSQKYLEKSLYIDEAEQGKGSVIEVNEEKGLGLTLNVILYDGHIKKGDEIGFLKGDHVGKTRIKILLQQSRHAGEKFSNVDVVYASAGIKIVGQDVTGAVAGSPLVVIKDWETDRANLENIKKNILFDTEEEGVILKADALGSLEAILLLFKKNDIPVRSSSIGPITKKDIAAASIISKRNKYLGVIFGFNVVVHKEAREEADKLGVKIIPSNIIYALLEDYNRWVEEEKIKEREIMMKEFSYPAKIKVLQGCFFRMSKPAIFGVEVLAGKIRQGDMLIDERGNQIGRIEGIQSEGMSFKESVRGAKVAISSQEIVLDKTIQERDVLYTFLTKAQIEIWKKREELLSEEERAVLAEIFGILYGEV